MQDWIGDDEDEAAGSDGALPPDERRSGWARRAALHYLERYASSEVNLVRVLRRKLRRRAERDPERWSLEPEEADRLVSAAVAGCRDLGLLDDAAFAEMKVAGGRRKGRSGRRILADMAAKGVPRVVAEAAMEGVGEDEERRAALVLARRRRLGPFSGEPRTPDRDRRDIATLCRQGYGYGLAREVVGLEREAAEAELAGEGAG